MMSFFFGLQKSYFFLVARPLTPPTTKKLFCSASLIYIIIFFSISYASLASMLFLCIALCICPLDVQRYMSNNKTCLCICSFLSLFLSKFYVTVPVPVTPDVDGASVVYEPDALLCLVYSCQRIQLQGQHTPIS